MKILVKKIKYAKYTKRGNNVLKDGHTMFLEDIVSDLSRKSYLEAEMEVLRKERDAYKKEYEQLFEAQKAEIERLEKEKTDYLENWRNCEKEKHKQEIIDAYWSGCSSWDSETTA